MKSITASIALLALILAVLHPSTAGLVRPAAAAPLSPLCNDSSSASTAFNATALAAGNTVWFVSRLKVSGLGSAVTTIYARQASISFTVNGTPRSISVPDARIIFDPAASTTTTSFDTTAQRWVTRVSSGNNGKNVFAGGVAFAIPAGGLPGGINPVTWTAALTVDQPGITFNWNWAAAVYTSFSTNYNAIGVKPVDGNAQNPYNNNDQAGAPENYKSSVTGGATGNGGTNYTGNWTSNLNVTPCQAYQVGDFVWHDANRDGLQSAGETGIADVQVNLFSPDGVMLESTSTSASGAYSFLTVPGSYYLEFVAPTGYAFTLPNQGANPALDSDADPVSGQTALFTLGAAQNLTWDAGLYRTGSLGDRIWYDRNYNGQQDSGEPGIADVGVFLYDAATIITSLDGKYRFRNVLPDSYFLFLDLPAGYVSVGRTNRTVTVAVGGSARANFALQAQSVLQGVVFDDLNGNGRFDEGEPLVPNWSFRLTNPQGNTSQATTGADGTVTLTNVPAGQWTVEELMASGWVGTGAITQTVNVPVNGQGGLVFGNVRPAPLSGTVWIDANSNQVRETSEAVRANTTLTLTGTTGLGQSITGTTVTDASGNYVFPNLMPGTYRVAVTVPAGMSATTPTARPNRVILSGVGNPNNDFGLNATTAQTAGAPAPSDSKLPSGAMRNASGSAPSTRRARLPAKGASFSRAQGAAASRWLKAWMSARSSMGPKRSGGPQAPALL